jgi:hypothetical protein
VAIEQGRIEKILSLDMSTKTGWAFFEMVIPPTISSKAPDLLLKEYGKIEQIHTPDGEYPGSFVTWAEDCFQKLKELIVRFSPDTLVVEETSAGSKAIYTQKILEWIHYRLAAFVVDTGLKIRYILTEEWRRETGCLMSKAESKHNQQVRKYKKKNGTSIAYNEEGKRVGRITRKHVNIRRANEVFGHVLKEPLRKKDEDTADSLLLGFCYFLRSTKREH